MLVKAQIKIIFLAFFAANISFAATTSPSPTNPANTEYLPNRGQADAFRTAAEVASAFGVYIESQDNKITNVDGNTSAKVSDCIKSPDSCDRDEVFKALIQYNLNKTAKAMVLRNETNAHNLEALGGRTVVNEGTSVTEKTPRQVFKIDLTKGFTTKIDPNEILGQQFQQDYRMFIKAYAAPNADNYITTTTTKDSSGRTIEIAATKNGQVIPDQAGLDRDMKMQELKPLQARAKELFDTPPTVKKTTDAKAEAEVDLGSLGFADPVSADTAKKYAQALNTEIDKSVKSTTTKDTDATYYMKADDFNNFLNKIWPPSAAPRQQ
jgi:hypothetical protein